MEMANTAQDVLNAQPAITLTALAWLGLAVSGVTALVGYIVRKSVADTGAELRGAIATVRAEGTETRTELRALATELRGQLGEHHSKLAAHEARLILLEGRSPQTRSTTRRKKGTAR